MDRVSGTKSNQSKGPREAELSYGGGADLHPQLEDCMKNPEHSKFLPVGHLNEMLLKTKISYEEEMDRHEPSKAKLSYGGEAKDSGHLDFIPVDQCNVDHLPPGYNDIEIIDLARAITGLIVQVSVKYVSDRRPETFPGSDTPYPLHGKTGSTLPRIGLGFVGGISEKRLNPLLKIFCKCVDCKMSSEPKTHFAAIYIQTAAHVVFDDLEAAQTTCHLFFGKETMADIDHVSLSDFSIKSINIPEDWCELRCYVHDQKLISYLEKMVTKLGSLQTKIKERYKHSKMPLGVKNITPFTSLQHFCKKMYPEPSVDVCGPITEPNLSEISLDYDDSLESTNGYLHGLNWILENIELSPLKII